MFYITFNTGAGDQWADTLEEAKALADEGAVYTQQPITIEDEAGNEIARRPWWGVAFDEDACDDESPILFGDYGYYGDWIDF